MYLQAVIGKVKSFHSSRSSLNVSNETAVASSSSSGSRRRQIRAYAPAHGPIHEETKEVSAGENRLTGNEDIEDEYVIQSQTFDDETFENVDATDVDKTREEADVAAADAARSAVKQEGPESLDRATSGVEGQHQAVSKSTISIQFSRQFVFGDDAKATGKVRMHSAWWLEETNREKSQVDAVLVEALRTAATDKHRLDDDERDAATTEKRLDKAAEELSDYAMKVSIRRSNDLSLSEMAIRAAAAVTLSMLNRAIHDEPSQLPASGPGPGCSPFQIHRAAVIVSHVLDEVANRNVAADAQPRWSKKALIAAILLVHDVLAKAITGDVRCADTECTVFTHVWTPPAIRASCRIIGEVMEEAALKASPGNERSTAMSRPTQPTSQLPVADAGDADRDQLALEEEAVARSSARLDTVGQQPSSLAMEPSELVVVDRSNNNSAFSNEVTLELSSLPTAGRSSEPAPDNANTNNAAAGIRGSGSRLRQLFGRRRRNI